jgi:hypothetical protein
MQAYLEKVWTEYIDYKDFIKENTKPAEELRKELASKITVGTTKEQAVEMVLEIMEKQNLYGADFRQQQNRLFFTVEAFKDEMEIPQEIKKELENVKFLQIFAIKNKKEEIIDQEALDFTKKQIAEVLSNGIEDFKKRFL